MAQVLQALATKRPPGMLARCCGWGTGRLLGPNLSSVGLAWPLAPLPRRREPSGELFGCQAREQHALVARGPARGERQGGKRGAEPAGKQAEQRLVGAPVFGRCAHRHFKSVSVDISCRLAAGPRLQVDAQDGTTACRGHQAGSFLGS